MANHEWRPVGKDGWIICDPTLDAAIEDLPAEVRAAIRTGKNVSYEQAQALARDG